MLKKTLYTLAVNNWQPEITAITYPLLKHYAAKCGAEFVVIDNRKFPAWPITYEKLQIFERGKEARNDWNIYIDSDALIHPETPDWTVYWPFDTSGQVGNDKSAIRWTFDEYMLRDGRDISSCNWFAFASSWCRDLWHPEEELTAEECMKRISPTVEESNCEIVNTYHLIDDYILSRNIARYGLKWRNVTNFMKDNEWGPSYFFWHAYTIPPEKKVEDMKNVLRQWRLL